MPVNVKEAVMIFRPELDLIISTDINAFAENMLSTAPEAFYQDEKLVTHVKKVFKLVNEMLVREGTGGPYRDMMLTAVLFSDMTLNSMPDDLKHLHPITISSIIREHGKELHSQVIDALIQMIEGHEGSRSPSRQLEPKMGQPGFIIALANQIARYEFVEINL
jgi:hypothetical protein